jgi:DNA-binding GntR family transcriptional regulator
MGSHEEVGTAPKETTPGGLHRRRAVARKRPSTTADISQNTVAYERIREAVITLVLAPGEVLNAGRLAASMRLGITPINRALQRLMNEGLVRIIPRKGVAVAPLSIDDAMSIIEVRRVMEAHCLELAAKRITAEEIDGLAGCVERYRKAAAARRISALLLADRDFHEQIALASRNQVLAEMLKVLHARSQRFWAVSLSRQQHIDEVDQEHAEILEALRQGSAKRARRAIERHIDSFHGNLTNVTHSTK